MLTLLFIAALCAGDALADITGTNPAPGTCLCLNVDAVNVRSSPCGSVTGTANNGECHRYVGSKQTCPISGTNYDFFHLECGNAGTQSWIAGTYLNVGSASQCQPAVNMAGNCDAVEKISRAQWGARAPTSVTPLNTPVSAVFIHHTVTASCFDVASCSSTMRGMQNYHMDTQGWTDIGYNWLVAEDGRAYEGRGFHTLGTHTGNWNSASVAISAIGDFTGGRPNDVLLNAIRNLIDCAKREGAVSSSYRLWGHRDAMQTSCPGDALYAEIMKWPDYSCTAAV